MMYMKIIFLGLALCAGIFGQGAYGEANESTWFEPGRATGSSSRCCSSVLFVPGFKGTRLFDGDRQLWEPNSNDDVRGLFLDESGQSINSDIVIGEMIQRTNVGFGIFDVDVYAGIAGFFDSLVSSGVIQNWDTLEYDWRLDLPLSQQLFWKIRDLAQHSFDGKVILIGHSNGGLMVKKVLSVVNPEFRDTAISAAVLVAAPQLGSSQAVASLLHGDGESMALGFFLNRETAREWGRNMPGAYNLLPSARLLGLKNTPLVSFEDGTSLSQFSELADFLLEPQPDGFSLNADLISNAAANHEGFDFLMPQDFGVPVYEIAGANYPTVSGLQYFTHKEQQDHRTLKTSAGDGVVELKSALVIKATSSVFDLGTFNSVQRKNIGHATILEARPVQDLISSIIKQASSSDSAFISAYSPQPLITFAVHSPVSLHITDSYGRTTEREKAEIPNSLYEEVGEGKYITLLQSGIGPQDKLEVFIRGTGSGTFSFDMQKTMDGVAETEALFSDIAVSSSTQARLTYSPGVGITQMEVDFEGDGVVDEVRKNENTKNRLVRAGKRILEAVQGRFGSVQEQEGHDDKDTNAEDGNEQNIGHVGSHSSDSLCEPC